MRCIERITRFDFENNTCTDSAIAKEIFNGKAGRMLEIDLANGGILSRHKSNEPISVLCINGQGSFRAGVDLEDSVELKPGSLISLDAGIEHEVVAEPELRLLITKFKRY